MNVDREKRLRLRESLTRYLRGEIRTYAFDEVNCACGDTTDEALRRITAELYRIHDDCRDHLISVEPLQWASLVRVVAFLGTDLDASTQAQPGWPFDDDAQWQAHQHLVQEHALPSYDPAIHGQEIHPWWDRIPSSVGFAILGVILAAMFAAIWSL